MALVKCKECKQDVASNAKTCPHCGVSSPGVTFVHSLGAIVILGVLGAFVLVSCSGDDEPKTVSNDRVASAEQQPAGMQWYQKGTLHQASGLEWQQGEYADKLATAADLIAKVKQIGSLKPQIAQQLNNTDDYKPFAAKLVVQLDDAFAPDPDPEKNKRLFANQTVSSTSAMVLVMMGWIQTGG